MPRRSLAGEPLEVSRSSIQMRPDVGEIIRLIMRSEVVLPQPDGPTKTVICPDGAVRDRSSTAGLLSAYTLDNDSKRIIRPSVLLYWRRAISLGRPRPGLWPAARQPARAC